MTEGKTVRSRNLLCGDQCQRLGQTPLDWGAGMPAEALPTPALLDEGKPLVVIAIMGMQQAERMPPELGGN